MLAKFRDHGLETDQRRTTEMFQGLSRLRLRAAEVVRMAFRRVILQRPFTVRIPNAETIAALNEPTHNLRQFDSVEDLFADINARNQAPHAVDPSESGT